MTLEEAGQNIGKGVVYAPSHGAREDGTIRSVMGDYVHVDYRGQVKATRPDDLTFLTAVA